MKVLDQAEIERRKPVWCALSDLWFDTELTEDDDEDGELDEDNGGRLGDEMLDETDENDVGTQQASVTT